jgi:DNA-binding LytR/AlgR family response regulator
MKIAICDDERILCENLYTLVKNQNEHCHVDIYASGDELLDAKKDYDIYFLDIQMSGIDGMKTAAQIREREESKESVIIFITALKEYMANAFDVKAFHYLVKPLDENKFKEVFSRAVSDYKKTSKNADKHILIKISNTYHKIFIKDISYIESQGKKVIIHLGSETTEYYGTIAELEKTLGNSFFRSHRCYLINLSYVTRYNATSIWLRTGEEIFLAQKKFQEFVKAYMLYAKSGGLADV